MQAPQGAIDLVKRFEGLFKIVTRTPAVTIVPYVCPAGFWTIGYGHLTTKDHPPISEGQAEEYLATDLQSALLSTLRSCPVLAVEPEWRLSPIVDFTFNLGGGALQTSTLRARINARDWNGAGEQLRRWVHAGGRVLAGLVSRREAERAMLLGVASE